ncbi:hypothetical protein ACFLS1_10350, partial [Verrucomicrobiota bacterium]
AIGISATVCKKKERGEGKKGSGYEMRNTLHEIRFTFHEIRFTLHEIRFTLHEMRGSEAATQEKRTSPSAKATEGQVQHPTSITPSLHHSIIVWGK